MSKEEVAEKRKAEATEAAASANAARERSGLFDLGFLFNS